MHCKLAVLMADKDARLSQKRLAEETGLGLMTVRRLFYNEFNRVDANTVETLCDYFGCGLGDLFELREVARSPLQETYSNFPSPTLCDRTHTQE